MKKHYNRNKIRNDMFTYRSKLTDTLNFLFSSAGLAAFVAAPPWPAAADIAGPFSAFGGAAACAEWL